MAFCSTILTAYCIHLVLYYQFAQGITHFKSLVGNIWLQIFHTIVSYSSLHFSPIWDHTGKFHKCIYNKAHFIYIHSTQLLNTPYYYPNSTPSTCILHVRHIVIFAFWNYVHVNAQIYMKNEFNVLKTLININLDNKTCIDTTQYMQNKLKKNYF